MNIIANTHTRQREKFIYSEFESDYFGLRIFRNNDSDLPEADSIKDFCIHHQPDLIRMKINVIHEEVINDVLFSTGFPFFYSHSVMTVFADYSKEDVATYKNDSLIFERYCGEAQKNRFKNLVFQGMGDDPIGYYKTPLINTIISKKAEALCYAEYYAQLYDGRDKNKIGYIMRKGNEDAGVFVFELEKEDSINTSMAAVLPQHRSAGLFHDMKVFRQRFCIESGIRKAYAGFRLNNFNTPNSLLKAGYRIIRAEHVFHIPCLLNRNT